MFFRVSRIFVLVSLVVVGTISAFSQSGVLPSGKPTDEEAAPKSFKESLEKMRIDKDKKDHEQMLERGEELLKLTEEIEKTAAPNGKIDDKEKPKLATVEKLAKKIRNELGGAEDDGDDDSDAPEAVKGKASLSPATAVQSLRASTQKLYDELKKTTRFTISAAAIQNTNSVLRITRFLRLTN